MSDKKHIDRLFQETFKDFEETPNDAVWERIEAQLKEKKKRRVIPIWWRYAGVAALLLLLLTVGNGYFNNNNILTNETPNQNRVVNTDENTNLNQSGTQNVTRDYKNPINSTIKNTEAITNNNASETHSKESPNNGITNKNQNVLNPSDSSSVAKNDAKAHGDNSSESVKKSKSNNTLQTKNNSESHIAQTNSSEEKTNKSSETNKAILDKTKLEDLLNTNKNSKESSVADVKIDNTEESKINSKTKQNQLTIEDAIEKIKDINEEEKEDLNRWSVAPNAAPVFFNSLGKGSSIDPQFNNNSKSSETNMSYGISASYAINNKISVRSGINKVNLGYNTNDVVLVQSLNGRSSISVLKNVRPEINNTASDVSVLSTQNFANKSSQSFATTTGINASINQSLSFIEIPLEIKYLLSDKKLGVNVIGGFSSFFLSDNELSSDFEGNKTHIGEASNINKTSYSANFGFGLDYKVSKKINLNLEPMFKYQINTFNDTSGDFKPYFIGVYTGFGIKF